MATLDDIKTALAGVEASQEAETALLQAESASIADLSAKLAAAMSSNDPAAMQAVVDQLNADKAKIDAAVAAASAPATPPTDPAPPSA